MAAQFPNNLASTEVPHGDGQCLSGHEDRTARDRARTDPAHLRLRALPANVAVKVPDSDSGLVVAGDPSVASHGNRPAVKLAERGSSHRDEHTDHRSKCLAEWLPNYDTS